MSIQELWFEALDKHGRVLGILHARTEEEAMGKARHIYGLAVIEVNLTEELV